MGFRVLRRVLGRVLRRGSEKAVSKRCLERPVGEYAPLGVRPILCQLSCAKCTEENFQENPWQTPSNKVLQNPKDGRHFSTQGLASPEKPELGI